MPRNDITGCCVVSSCSGRSNLEMFSKRQVKEGELRSNIIAHSERYRRDQKKPVGQRTELALESRSRVAQQLSEIPPATVLSEHRAYISTNGW